MTTAEMLSHLGVTANYKGFPYIISAVELCLENQDCLHLMTKYVYPKVARQYKTSWQAVERDIRTAGAVVWARNPILLERLARRPLGRKPSNGQLLAILTVAMGERAEGPAEQGRPYPGRE